MEMQKLRILILEDFSADAELMCRELKKGEIDFIELITDTEKKFTEALSEFKPDIILSDYSLPGFNSTQALAICKKLEVKCPFILITGAVSEEFAVECIKSGIDDYILKSNLKRLPNAVIGALKKAESEKEKEKAIRNLEEQNIFMSLLLKSIPVAQYISKMGSHEITYMSTNIFSFSGYHPNQFVENPDFWKNQIHTDDFLNVIQVFSNLSEDNETSIEYRWLVSDGTYRWIYDRAKIIKNDQGVSYIAGAMIDITLRKETEEKLILKNKELNTFIYRSTHDLRGPLMTILGLTSVAQDEDELQEIRNYISLIDECTHKLDDVLLALITTISIKETKIAPKNINFNEIINVISEDCKEIPGFNKINLIKDISVNKSPFMDDFAITSILKNLIDNAIKYSNSTISNPMVSISINNTETELSIVITDNGIGIPAGIQERVFEMFFRGTMVCKGSGLGLYIVKNAVEKLKGSIVLNSKEGVGTRIEVKIPIQ